MQKLERFARNFPAGDDVARHENAFRDLHQQEQDNAEHGQRDDAGEQELRVPLRTSASVARIER